MLRFSVSKFLPSGVSSAAGTVIGEDHRREILRTLSAADRETPTLFVLDYEGVENVTSSYVKRTALWLLRCGTTSCPTTGRLDPDDLLGDLGGVAPLPSNVFPVAANLAGDVREEFDEVFARRALPFLEALDFDATTVRSAQILGRPEPSVRDTLAAIKDLGCQEATAKTLFGSARNGGIGLTAWGNRLADLHRLRLLDRRKLGKEWIYRPIVKTFCYGRKN